jgi:agmatine deiminase
MSWRMPSETVPHERTWMAFPRAGTTLGEALAWQQTGYEAWTAVAHAIAAFEPVTMVVDPSERERAKRMLGSHIEQVEAPLDEFWMRDFGPTFVLDDDRPGVLGAVDWIFNGWGDHGWAEWKQSAEIARFIANHCGAELVSSMLVNEGGGIHVDGEGTVLVTDTVQLDPRRNPYADRSRVEAELARTLGAKKAIWLPRGLTRDYDSFGTSGHVDRRHHRLARHAAAAPPAQSRASRSSGHARTSRLSGRYHGRCRTPLDHPRSRCAGHNPRRGWLR